MNAQTQFRLFVALATPEEIKDQIEQAQAELRRAVGEARVRWTVREQFHLTLKFLGDVAEPKVEPLAAALQVACCKFSPLHLRAAKVGFFPNLRAPRVAWIGVEDAQQQLPRLHEAIEAAVREYTTEPTEERFAGHITVGRIKSIWKPEAEALGKAAGKMADRCFGQWTATEVELIRSVLSSEGASYTTLAAVPFLGHSA